MTTVPTIGFNVETVQYKNLRFQVWDLGGQDKLRKVWSTYYVGAHAVVLVVDSMDRERISLVREELATITANEVRVRPSINNVGAGTRAEAPRARARRSCALSSCLCSPTSKTSRAP